MRTNNLCCTC